LQEDEQEVNNYLSTFVKKRIPTKHQEVTEETFVNIEEI
jgi:hypothetical protein